MRCYNPLPPPWKELSSWDFSVRKSGARFRSFTLMARSRDNWSGDSLHIPKWLYLLNYHSIGPYKTEWSSFLWLNLVDPIPWSDSTCRSSQVLVECCLQLPHSLGASDIFWVGIYGIHYAHWTILMVAPLGTLEVHTSQEWDIDQCSEGLASLLCQNDVHLSSERLKGIHDHQPQIPRHDLSYWCSSFDGIVQSICWLKFVSPSLLPLSQCQDQR
jgi:hypothetical protein